MTAKELVRRMRAKDVSAREVMDAHLHRIEQVNPKVNAIVTLSGDQARKRAEQLDEEAAHGRFAGPLHGLPIAHKDLVETKGMRTTFGSPIFAEYVPDFDTLLVERIRRAGAIAIGKTNTPEFGAGSQTFNPVFGATRNPWDLTKTCGGSSGGAATALACRMLPIADGSDMGGSLRNPASFCSVVGFRTSPGRVPKYPARNGWSPLAVDGPMARTVEDVALFLSAIAGPDPRAPLSIEEASSRFQEPLDRNLKGVKIGWCVRLEGMTFDPRVEEVFSRSRQMFEAIGCITEDVAPDFTGADQAFRTLRAHGFHGQLGALLPQYRERIKSTVVDELERGSRLTGPEIAEADRLRSELYARFGVIMSKFEYLALPVSQVPPFPIDQEYVTEIAGVKMATYIDWMRSCYWITMTSLPAISVPAGFTRDGLPVGVQIVGRHQADLAVLQLAYALQEAASIAGVPPV